MGVLLEMTSVEVTTSAELELDLKPSQLMHFCPMIPGFGSPGAMEAFM